jgi:lysophospholipid acyltransferase (LPLAT)-like uncharacterized protein
MAQLTFLRTLFTENKLLDTLRINFFHWFYREGSRFMCSSYDPLYIVGQDASDYVYKNKPAIFALFHGRMLGIMRLDPLTSVTVLISASRDGEIIARALRDLGISSVRGSPNRRGVKGALEFVAAGKSGRRLAYTVDGPRGPRYQVSPGVIRLASMSGLPIIPFVCRGRGNWWMPTWDKFMASHWGGPCVYMFNDPIFVPSNASDEEQEKLRAELEQQMNKMRLYLDELLA